MTYTASNPVSASEGYKFINALVAAGFTSAHAHMGIMSPELASEVVALCNQHRADSQNPNITSLAQAKAIMGGNFHDSAQWASKCGFQLTEEHIATFSMVPFNTELLMQLKETHILVPILPLSIMQLHGIFSGLFNQKDDSLYRTEVYATNQPRVGWMLFMREVVPGSTSRSWRNQQALVSCGEHVPSAAELVQAVICHAVLTEERLLLELYARTSSVDSDGRHVRVGFFDATGFFLYGWNDDANSLVGVSASLG